MRVQRGADRPSRRGGLGDELDIPEFIPNL
jgi:hypothetical protein